MDALDKQVIPRTGDEAGYGNPGQASDTPREKRSGGWQWTDYRAGSIGRRADKRMIFHSLSTLLFAKWRYFERMKIADYPT